VLSSTQVKRAFKRKSPKSTVEETRSGGWRIFLGGASGRLQSLVVTDEEADTMKFIIGLRTSRDYAPTELAKMINDMLVGFDAERGVMIWRYGRDDLRSKS